MFRDYFSPDRASVVLNFVLLGAVALSAVVLGTMFLTMGLMIGRGLKLRAGISTGVARIGRGWSLSFVMMGAVLLLSLLLLPLGTTWVAMAWILAPVARFAGARIGRVMSAA